MSNRTEMLSILSRIGDLLPSIVYVFDLAEQRLVYCSRRIESALGYPPEELQAMQASGLYQILHPEDRARFASHRSRFGEQECVVETEYRLRHANGEWLWFRSRESIFRRGDADGQPIQIVGTAEDVTGEKRAERVLAEERFYALLEAAPDAIILTDHAGTIRVVGSRAERMFGYSRTELVGRRIEMLLPERFRAQHVEHRRECAEAPERGPMGAELDLAGLRKDGTEFPIEVSLSSIEMGDESFVATAIRDITDRREVQLESEKQARLASIGQLAAGIAHDFNNILTVVIGVAERLSASSRLPGPIRSKLQLVAQQGQRGRQLVRQILDFSRQSAAINPEEVEMDASSAEVVKLLERTIPDNIAIIRETEPGEFRISADPTHIHQILTNLVLNARDAMPSGGPLRIRLSHFELRPGEQAPVRGMRAGGWVLLSVSDQGTGMSPEILEHVFEPFFSTKQPGYGTGLGLAQVYGLVRQNGGFIDVHSEQGGGTTFHIYFPVSEAQAPGPEEPAKRRSPRGRGETVLVVEDDPVVRTVNVWLLKDLGYRALAARDGDEALDVFSLHRGEVSLVLLDLFIPGTDSRELYRRLRRDRPDLPIVICSGYAVDDADQRRGFEDVAYWLQKPVEPDELATTVRDALARGVSRAELSS